QNWEELPRNPLGRGILLVAVGTAEKRNPLGGSRVRVALDAGPRAAVRVPEGAPELGGLLCVPGGGPPRHERGLPLARVPQEPLAQVHVVPTHALGDLAVRSDALQKEDAGTPGRNRARDVRLGQADRRLYPGRRRKAWKEGKLRRVGRRCVEARA